MNVIEVHNLVKRFDQFQLHLPDLTVQQGYITGLIGENGAGKTTLIQLLMNMRFANEGSVRIFEQDVATHAVEIKQHLGYIGDMMGYPTKMPIGLLKRLFSSFYTTWDDALYQKYMHHFGLDEKKKYMDLSKGMQKQFSLIVALSHHPKLLILDEPTANLDPMTRTEFLDILLDQMDRDDLSVFFSTHITSDLDKIADDIIFLNQGSLLMSDNRDHLLESHRIIRGNSDLLIPEVIDTLVNYSRNTIGFEGLTNDWKKSYELLGDEVTYEPATLENIFVHYISSKKRIQKGV